MLFVFFRSQPHRLPYRRCARLLLCLLLMLYATGIQAAVTQSAPLVVLKGIILNNSTQMPIPYATVTLYPQEQTVQANSDGLFTVSVDPESKSGKLKVYALGYTAAEFNLPELLQQYAPETPLPLKLQPNGVNLSEVEVKSRGKKRKVSQVGFNIGKGSPFEHALEPVDSTVTDASAGKEIGNRIYFKKYPAALQKVSFGFSGSGSEQVALRIKVYSLKNDMPHQNLLPDYVMARVPAHFTGWVTVNLSRYNLTVQEDFVVVVEWLKGSNKLSNYSLMSFASMQKNQVTYHRDSTQNPWSTLATTSIGMYATLVHE